MLLPGHPQPDEHLPEPEEPQMNPALPTNLRMRSKHKRSKVILHKPFQALMGAICPPASHYVSAYTWPVCN